ncbi:hypothetical protein ACFS2C_24725 [Prauserella oleivorans]|uniref:WXG100 family type VII secretion target n=1 Tax=Prauserella oleivorans TaxID=1478153 RepID=A0ABW5WHI3_9PSEU
MSDTATYAREAHEVLRSIESKKDVWTGEASRAFAERLGELPGYVDSAHTSLRDAGKALNTWGDRLEAHQKRARELEEQARQAIDAAEQADAAAQHANASANTPVMHDGSPASVSAAQREVQQKAAAAQANRAAGEAWARVDEIRRQAEQLKETWEDDARACADALNRAAELAPDKGLLESIGDAFADAGDWVMNNLGKIGDVAGMISAVAGALSFIPGLAPFTGPIAIAAGGVALLAHGGEMVKEGKWDDPTARVGLGTDVLGVLPGVGAVAKGGSMATASLQSVEGIGSAAAAGGRVFLDEVGKVAEPAKMFDWVGRKTAEMIGGNAETIAVATQNTVNLGVQAPVLGDLVVGNETSKAIKDGTGYFAGAAAAGGSVGQWSDARSGIGNLGRSLADFARAVN